MKKKTPYITAGTNIIVKYAGPRSRSVNRRIGRSGWVRRRSTWTNENSRAALSTKELSVTCLLYTSNGVTRCIDVDETRVDVFATHRTQDVQPNLIVSEEAGEADAQPES